MLREVARAADLEDVFDDAGLALLCELVCFVFEADVAVCEVFLAGVGASACPAASPVNKKQSKLLETIHRRI